MTDMRTQNNDVGRVSRQPSCCLRCMAPQDGGAGAEVAEQPHGSSGGSCILYCRANSALLIRGALFLCQVIECLNSTYTLKMSRCGSILHSRAEPPQPVWASVLRSSTTFKCVISPRKRFCKGFVNTVHLLCLLAQLERHFGRRKERGGWPFGLSTWKAQCTRRDLHRRKGKSPHPHFPSSVDVSQVTLYKHK